MRYFVLSALFVLISVQNYAQKHNKIIITHHDSSVFESTIGTIISQKWTILNQDKVFYLITLGPKTIQYGDVTPYILISDSTVEITGSMLSWLGGTFPIEDKHSLRWYWDALDALGLQLCKKLNGEISYIRE